MIPQFKTWDESASGNKITVPFGHIWKVLYAYIDYVADANVATRVTLLTFNINGGAAMPEEPEFLQGFVAASESKIFYFGEKDTINPYDGSQEAPPNGIYLAGNDEAILKVTNEQAGDTWDVILSVLVGVQARA